ncbi:hypothetical protein [Mesorhizobium sp. B4-1-4]|uniref:hypothetical protein n=1 Tax=Mesorhizobium sp. B4-1-4 TaxID=2589888 RepID=UPI001D027094|nr:hypothetical protein [Mesorhizobium sp. B4-1-4]UCI30316.1 hypothetical protein FJW03_21240 [Mesorhizobium sp. B4-1-4]
MRSASLLTSSPDTNLQSSINAQNKTPPKIDGVRQQSERRQETGAAFLCSGGWQKRGDS